MEPAAAHVETACRRDLARTMRKQRGARSRLWGLGHVSATGDSPGGPSLAEPPGFRPMGTVRKRTTATLHL